MGALMLSEISLKTFYPIFLPYTNKELIPTELVEVLGSTFKKISYAKENYQLAEDFLFEYSGSKNNYDSYRSEIVVFLNWCWANKLDLKDVKRKEMALFINFCNNPPTELISRYANRSIITDPNAKSEIALNLDWRPFKNANPEQPYSRTKATITKTLSILSSFYTYLNDCDQVLGNPASIVLRRLNIESLDNVKPTSDSDKSMSMLQVATMFDVLEDLCRENPIKYERTRFLLHLLILAFPRRSEISASLIYSPMMSDFQRVRVGDHFHWVFHIRKAKRGKSRKVLCSSKLIEALSRYRLYMGLSALPSSDDTNPVFTRHRAASHGRQAGIVDANLSSNAISELVLEIFSVTADRLEFEMLEVDEAKQLRELSIHSTRHTGISLALHAGRSPEKLMIDSGHSSFASFKIYMSNRIDFRIGEVNLIDELLSEYK